MTTTSPQPGEARASIDLLDLTLPTPAENLALDEALLNEAEDAARHGENAGELLRLWESPVPFVVLGSTGRVAEEVHREACRRSGVAVLRRSSGGGTVLMGPGCLCFSLILDLEARPDLREIHASYRAILGRIARCLAVEGLAHRGISDLALAGHKVSGNAQRRKSATLLHHGSLLYDFDLGAIAALLKDPARQPDYRAGRTHAGFVANFALPAEQIRRRLAECWNASEPRVPRTLPGLGPLLQEKYANPSWIERF
jgi:lipoate---protein ligase